jgi:ABC-type dipeptide/oligopeptide/nickel transport system permease component
MKSSPVRHRHKPGRNTDRSPFFPRLPLVPVLIPVLMLIIHIVQTSSGVDATDFEIARVMRDLRYLSSPELEGRFPGSEGNLAALDFLIDELEMAGINPSPDTGVYRQNFALAASSISDARFAIDGIEGGRREARLYRDYSILPWSSIDGMDFAGEFILLGERLFDTDPSLLENRIAIIQAPRLDMRAVQRAKDAGARALLLSSPPTYYENEILLGAEIRHTDLDNLFAAELPIAIISNEFALAVSSSALPLYSSGTGVSESPMIARGIMSYDIAFPIIETANIVGWIPGRSDRTLVLSAEIGGMGSLPDGGYFPGASNGAAGSALLLEIARLISTQNRQPLWNICLVFINAGELSSVGSQSLLQDPGIAGAAVHVHISDIGNGEEPYLQAGSAGDPGVVLRSRLAKIAAVGRTPMLQRGVGDKSPVIPFLNRGIPSVELGSGERIPDDTQDHPDRISEAELAGSARLLLDYISRRTFGGGLEPAIPSGLIAFLAGISIAILPVSLVASWYRYRPDRIILGMDAEQVFFHPLFQFWGAAMRWIIAVGAALLLFTVFMFLPSDGQIVRSGGMSISNYLPDLIIGNTWHFLTSWIRMGSGRAFGDWIDIQVLTRAVLNSGLLILTAASLALAGGIGIGVLLRFRREAYESGGGWSAMVLSSVPDLMVILLLIALRIVIARAFPGAEAVNGINRFLLPVLAAGLIPLAYTAKLSALAVEQEALRGHILHARSLGFSPRDILIFDLLRPALARVMDAMPLLLGIMFANLILVEYFFDYRGMVYYLLYFLNRGDQQSYILYSLTLAGMYLAFTWIAGLISRRIHPARRSLR